MQGFNLIKENISHSLGPPWDWGPPSPMGPLDKTALLITPERQLRIITIIIRFFTRITLSFRVELWLDQIYSERRVCVTAMV
jgi:hypothetical protein